jgi:hypothetical protein
MLINARSNGGESHDSAQASIAANRMPSMAALAPSIHRLAAGYVRLDRSMEKASATII